MGVVGKRADDLDARLDLCVGCVDDAERRFSTRHQCQRRAYIFRHREFWSGGGPRPELFQRRFCVFPDRHRAHIAGCNASVARKPREIEAEMMRADARFHADQARRRVGKPRFHLAARPFLPQHDGTALIYMPDLDRLGRYERRAWSRQKRAFREFIEIKSRRES
jgi:hypothetical protein